LIEKTKTGFLLEFTPDLFMGRNDKRTREREMRLLVGATLCGRSKTIIGKWQLIIKISSTLWGEDKGEGKINTLSIADWKNHLKCEMYLFDCQICKI